MPPSTVISGRGRKIALADLDLHFLDLTHKRRQVFRQRIQKLLALLRGRVLLRLAAMLHGADELEIVHPQLDVLRAAKRDGHAAARALGKAFPRNAGAWISYPCDRIRRAVEPLAHQRHRDGRLDVAGEPIGRRAEDLGGRVALAAAENAASTPVLCRSENSTSCAIHVEAVKRYEHKLVESLVDQAAADVLQHPAICLGAERHRTVAFVDPPDVMRRIAERHQRRVQHIRLAGGSLNDPAGNNAVQAQRRVRVTVTFAASDWNEDRAVTVRGELVAHRDRTQVQDVEGLER